MSNENNVHIKESDLLLYDRGYIDRDFINTLKRGKDTAVMCRSGRTCSYLKSQ